MTKVNWKLYIYIYIYIYIYTYYIHRRYISHPRECFIAHFLLSESNYSQVSGCVLQTAQTWANAGVCSASCAHAFGCVFVCLFVITCLFVLQAI